ncbi:DUF6543 domain-containing protein [Pseudomonas sp.]|uniref:dermonecrotic toxin domain-containing protein n=1 Tax=Pseudomonas sp. TaxID=306 RepID=UPI0032633478
MPDLPPRPDAGKPPAATLSIHGDFLENAVPQWLVDATPARRLALKEAEPVLPAWYANASPQQRKTYDASLKASVTAQVQLDTTMKTFLDVDAFARPLLLKALNDQYHVQVDVDKTLLCLRRPLALGALQVEISSFEFLKLPMLQAALHNFEAWECKPGAYHKTSGYVLETTTAGTYTPTTVNLTVSQFMSLCRSLDIGAQYQTYLNSFFEPVDASPEPALRQHFIASQKATMKAAADLAVLAGDIEPADHAMILSVIGGNVYPMLGGKRVWPFDMSLMKKRLVGCVYFVIGDRHSDELILYIPHDPAHPLKRYTRQQMCDELKRLFTARDGMAAGDPAPTAYQRFFSQFLPYDQQHYYFSQFTQRSADSPSNPLASPWRTFVETFLGLSVFTQIKELPPEKNLKLEPVDDPYLAPGNLMPFRGKGIFSGLLDLWPFLYEKHRDKVLADARAHAVPTAEVDTKAREAKLAHVLELGMLAFNLVSMFVPVLGEVMLGLMVEQLLAETLEGAAEWAEGDKRAAKAHLVDVAENLAQIAVMAGVGALASRFRAVKPEPVLEGLSPVTLPNGETRLWKADLKGYESTVTLDASPGANALGQHTLDGKTYIRQGQAVYETFYDDSINTWRIKHPTDAEAYQPVLGSNGRGAWRHTLERPLEWDRLTLLRRMGHDTEAFSDAELINVADVSGVSDNALRKMHVDHAAPPPELLDAMRLFKADAGVEQVIAQLQGTQPITERYLYVLPLVTEMPRWPNTRVLEVFKGPGLSGESVKYGAGRLPRGAVAKAAIKVSRADVLGGQLPAVILAALDDSEVTRLLGGEGARVKHLRPQEFAKQIAEYAQTRKPAIFDSIYAGSEPDNTQVKLLQRTCPGLSEAAAQETLANASLDDLKRLEATRRVPLPMLEEARWYAHQGRQTRAYAGLRSDTMASADSRRLALHSLEKLPGWPDTLRLEVRQGSDSGTLLDSIGPDMARDKKYLVKKGPRFQAFNERGEELNSLPKEGDNFYASLMHALPDEARQALGVPQVSQSAQLRAKIIACPELNRSQTPQLLEPQRKGFKPPVRVNRKLVGYYASGRGEGLNPSLSTRARDVYPEMSDSEADGFILQLRRTYPTDRAIFNHLHNLSREYQALESTLDDWVRQPAGAQPDPFSRQSTSRRQAATALKQAWRRAPLAGRIPAAASLKLVIGDTLPPLTADFSHVRELSISGRGMNDTNADAFLQRFPEVEKLTIEQVNPLESLAGINRRCLTTLPQSVKAMRALKQLKFHLDEYAAVADFSTNLRELTALEELHIDYTGRDHSDMRMLDFSALVNLKKLKVEAHTVLWEWPSSVEQLPVLERLDLASTNISALPERLFVGHERLQSGLSLNWSRFSRDAFKPVYACASLPSTSAGHLIDLDLMVRDYAKGELQSLYNHHPIAQVLHERILTDFPTPQTRFAAIDALSAEHAALFDRFYEPALPNFRFRLLRSTWHTTERSSVIHALKASWGRAAAKRYGVDLDASVLQLPSPESKGFVARLPDNRVKLPELPAGSFSHVKTLRMNWAGETLEQTRGFLRAFSDVRSLELNEVSLTEWPVHAADFPALTSLNLSRNRLVITPQVQAQLNGLSNLERLDLSHNPLGVVDVSALTGLEALNLKATNLTAWPAGAEHLPQLEWVDIRDNNLLTIPAQVLSNDEALMKVNTLGNPWLRGDVDIRAARKRIEAAKGLPEGTLQRFEQEPVPATFPPLDTARSLARTLLPLPEPLVELQGAAGFVKRLQRLNPAVTEEQALQRIEQLRSGGMSDAQINTQLSAWHQDFETLTRQLNGWLYTREPQGPGVHASAATRRTVAANIRECWQGGLLPEARQELNLQGLQTGDLPALNVQFPRVHTLDLSGARISVQGSNAFLECFSQLRTLVLSGNGLTGVPDAVLRMPRLERLELASNQLSDTQALYQHPNVARLVWLDVSHNNLSQFVGTGFNQLQTLNLSYNRIMFWPEGVLEAPNLRTLDLSGNELTDFPDRLLDGTHEELVAGVDLSENADLTLHSYEQMSRYSPNGTTAPLMGFSQNEIRQRIAAFEEAEAGSEATSREDSSDESASDSETDVDEAYEPLELIIDPDGDVGEAALAPWLMNTPAALQAVRRLEWGQLAQESGHEAFFHLLARLQDTAEFRFTRADLTRRVWEVIESAAYRAEQREVLFAAAQTHNTCIDGRTLTFSNMEVLVYEERELLGVPADDLRQRGQRLLNLSRRLFRLDRVDTLSEIHGSRAVDSAERRLQYRIGMRNVWPDGLELPGQPSYMTYARPIEGQRLIEARDSVLAAEASDAFYESLISRDYWINYLKGRYPEVFEALETNALSRQEALEDEHSDRVAGTASQERYEVALNLLEVELGSTRAQRLMGLSRQEALILTPETQAGPPASPQPGPSTRQ